MIVIRLARFADGDPMRLTMTGHANRGPYGEDIVCAAASALVETLTMGLEEVLHERPHGVVSDGEADLEFTRPLSREARAVVETFLVGFQDLARTEPRAVRYVEISSSSYLNENGKGRT